MTAETLARELEVSKRTVLRDIEALSAAGVPVYAERGRHGGFALLPGFRTELMGWNHDEALALLTAGSGRGEQVFGLSAPLASAMRKLVDALPDSHQANAKDAAQRFLVDPEIDLLARRQPAEKIDGSAMAAIRRAVLDGRRLRIHYAATGRKPRCHTVDPIGLVTVRGKGYLLALSAGADRTYRLDRVLDAEALAEAAQRPDVVDLEKLWLERSTCFRESGDQIEVRARIDPARREELVNTALGMRLEETGTGGWLHITATFQDARHAAWAFTQLGTAAEVLAPDPIRALLRSNAAAVLELYRARD